MIDEYIENKIKILTEDFLCTPTEEELTEIKKRTTIESVDRYARHILKTHWDEEDNRMFDNFDVVEDTREAIAGTSSPWGNSTVRITMSDIVALFSGKLLYHFDGEYGTFVELDPDVLSVYEEIKALVKEDKTDE